ncbi:hypothetical protein SH139x_002494 [Planctomycetaceae bacterium SH139]
MNERSAGKKFTAIAFLILVALIGVWYSIIARDIAEDQEERERTQQLLERNEENLRILNDNQQ